MNDPSLLSKTVRKGTHHRVQHGVAWGQPAGCTSRLFINTEGESGAQRGAVLFCFGFFLEQWGQNCKGQERTLKTHFMGLSQMTLMWSAHDFQAMLSGDRRGGGGDVLLQTQSFLVLPCGLFASDPELLFTPGNLSALSKGDSQKVLGDCNVHQGQAWRR